MSKFIKVVSNDKFFSYYTYFAVCSLACWFIFSCFFKPIEHILGASIVLFLAGGGLLFINYKFIKFKRTFRYVLLELTFVPAVLTAAVIVALTIAWSMSWLPERTLTVILGISVFLAAPVSSWLIVRGKRKDETYLKMTRVILDYTETVYWILLSVVLFLFVSDTQNVNSYGIDPKFGNMLKLLILPFMIQTRLVKAYAGHMLQKLEFKSKRIKKPNQSA